MIGLAIILAGLPFYWFWKVRGKGTGAEPGPSA